MKKVNVNMTKCFGIKEFDYEFDFLDNSAITIYARNGLMKTSFSKTFKKIQDKKENEIKDEIFDLQGTIDAKIDDKKIEAGDVFVIKSYEDSYESANVAALLVDDSIKTRIDRVLMLKDRCLKLLEKYSGVKISATSLGKKVYRLEAALVEDFEFEEFSFLLNIKEMMDIDLEYECSEIKYSDIFDNTVMKKIQTAEFQEKIADFLEKSNEIYQEYNFLEKGKFTLPKLKDIGKNIEKGQFFAKDNYLYLEGGYEIRDIRDFNRTVENIEEKLKAVPAFQGIEKLLSDSKGVVLKDVIENNPEIIEYLAIEKLPVLKRQMWKSYILAEQGVFEELNREYLALEADIEDIDLNHTMWKNALDIFSERFTVPYNMKIVNLKGAIIGESIPRVMFSFEQDAKVVQLERDQLDGLDVLSQGEKRALYLLNIIFDIEQRKMLGRETLFIIDDIADSFDYKNKYAIVEYLYEMSLVEEFKLIILSHNFDFYRTVSQRLGVKRINRLCAGISGERVQLEQEKYQDKPFIYWKETPTLIHVLALIPFVRNLIEYGIDRKKERVSGINEDYILLTHLLHEKKQTKTISFDVLSGVYKDYLGIDGFKKDIELSDTVIIKLYDVAEGITLQNTDLEYKLILAMAIRHRAESFMISAIRKYSGILTWKVRGQEILGKSIKCMEYIDSNSSQTRNLLNVYKQFGAECVFKTLEEVNIMTPENIHINSFMYEPILDMDISELLGLYAKVKVL